VFTAEFVAQCERTLRPGGRLHVVTDVEEYFKVIVDLITQHTRLQPVSLPETAGSVGEGDYLTNFERKFRQEGRPIHCGTYEKQ
jgi:tRNA (guanine-N7-)-methyltransferase